MCQSALEYDFDQSFGHHATRKRKYYIVPRYECGAEEDTYNPPRKLLLTSFAATGGPVADNMKQDRTIIPTGWRDKTNKRKPSYSSYSQFFEWSVEFWELLKVHRHRQPSGPALSALEQRSYERTGPPPSVPNQSAPPQQCSLGGERRWSSDTEWGLRKSHFGVAGMPV